MKNEKKYFYIGVVILELIAIFFLILSILTVVSYRESNWYLPIALALNSITLYLNIVQKKKEKKDGTIIARKVIFCEGVMRHEEKRTACQNKGKGIPQKQFRL